MSLTKIVQLQLMPSNALPILSLLVMFIPVGHAHAETDIFQPNILSASLRSSEANDAFHGEIIIEDSLTPYTSGRLGLSFFVSDDTGIYGGLEGGLRTGMPWRLSPFVGAGIFLGQWTTYEPANNDGIDNDGDDSVDEYDEEAEHRDHLLAVYPEAGFHLWLSENVRLTATARYFMTTKGRRTDRALYGTGIAFRF